jgi:predicted ribosome quality control (RQC) complex YloA/Tae2 family protein
MLRWEVTVGKRQDAMPRWLWGPLPGIRVRSALQPQAPDYAEEKPKFKEDYFKSADAPQDKQRQKQKNTTTRRTMQTGSGVTIIDGRDEQQTDRKIFESGEGEYVEFEEV